MLGRHAGNQLRQDITLAAVGDHDLGGAAIGKLRGDLQRADRTAGDQNPAATITFDTVILRRMYRAQAAAESVEAGDLRHLRRAVAAARDDHPLEHVLPNAPARDRAHEPAAVRRTLQRLDARGQPQMRQQAGGEGIAFEIVEHVLLARVDRRAGRMVEIGEGSHHPAGIGVHARPRCARRRGRVPLAADPGCRLEDHRLQPVGAQPSAGGQAAGAGADDRYRILRHDGCLFLLHGFAPWVVMERGYRRMRCARFLKAS